MRLRWLLVLFLAPALVFGATPGNAATPGIRSTKEYQQLKAYVQQLQVKKSQPQTAAQIARYRGELAQKRTKASMKVRDLYQQQLSQAKDRRDVRKAKVVRLKQQKRKTISALKNAEQGRLLAIAADRRAELARINTAYSAKLGNLTKQRNRLQARIAKAKNPVKKQNLQDQLKAVQDQIDALAREKQDDITIANNKYDDQVQTTKENYDQKIEQATDQADRNIATLQRQLRDLYTESKRNAQERRRNQFADVKALYDRGVGYINEMQPSGEGNDNNA